MAGAILCCRTSGNDQVGWASTAQGIEFGVMGDVYARDDQTARGLAPHLPLSNRSDGERGQ